MRKYDAYCQDNVKIMQYTMHDSRMSMLNFGITAINSAIPKMVK